MEISRENTNIPYILKSRDYFLSDPTLSEIKNGTAIKYKKMETEFHIMADWSFNFYYNGELLENFQVNNDVNLTLDRLEIIIERDKEIEKINLK